MERRVVRPLLGAAMFALVTACSSSGPAATSTTTVVTATTTAAATSTTTVAPTSTAASATTATGPAAPTTAAPVPSAAIVPEVVCIDTSNADEVAPTTTVAIVSAGSTPTAAPASPGPVLGAETLVYFAYQNPVGVPVAVPKGDDNQLAGGAPDDDPLLPTVFAAGRVSPAFVAIVNATGDLPTWTLRGTDGVVRTAAPTAATPECDGTPERTPPDTRAPDVAITFGPSVVGTAAAPAVAVTIRITDLPALSECPAGLTPLPPVVTHLVASPTQVEATKLQAGEDGVATLERPVAPLPIVSTPTKGVRIHVDTFVADRCQGAGATTLSWATSADIEALAGGLGATCAAVDGTTVRPATTDECPVLGATGGIKIRRLS